MEKLRIMLQSHHIQVKLTLWLYRFYNSGKPLPSNSIELLQRGYLPWPVKDWVVSEGDAEDLAAAAAACSCMLSPRSGKATASSFLPRT